MATQRSSLTAVDDVFMRDRAGIAACSKIIREGLDRKTDLSDVERATSFEDVHPCIEKDSLRRIGIVASDSVLDVMVRYPCIMLNTRLASEQTMAVKGRPVHPYIVVVEPGRVVMLPEFLDLAADTLGQVYWLARNSSHAGELFAIERAMSAEVDALYREQLEPLTSKLAEPKIELQRWVVRGVYDRSVLGIPQFGISVEEWETDITLRGLSGEQRHRLLNRYRQNQDIFDFLDGVLFYCTRDPLDPQRRFFPNPDAARERRSTRTRELTKIALWLSGIIEGPESSAPRAGTDRSDSAFLLRALRLATSDPETLRIQQYIVNLFLWRHKNYWESAQGSSLYGLLGTSFKRVWLRWIKDGTLDGDVWVDEFGHAHRGRLKQELRSDEALDYIANRHKMGARSAKRPDCSDYDGDLESGPGFFEEVLDTKSGGLEQVETDEYHARQFQEIETAQRLVNITDADLSNDEVSSAVRGWRNLWIYKRSSSLDGGDFEQYIDPEIDIQRAIDQVYEVTRPSPVLHDQRPITTTYQSNGFITVGSKRAAERAKRDADVFIMRVCEDADDNDIPLLSGLSTKKAAAAIKNISDGRNGEKIWKALKRGRMPVRKSPARKVTGGAFGVPCACRLMPISPSRHAQRHGPCKVIMRDGVKLDRPEVLHAPPEVADL